MAPKASGYGLPCAKCRPITGRTTCCPVCKSAERVSPTIQAPDVPPAPVFEAAPDPEVLEQERERFLQEFKAQIMPADLQIDATASFRCSKEENHEGAFELAAVCQGCYDHLREQADQFEAALLIDVKEAAQIIYEAVWSDPSDPSKTYQNAAQALLNELRKRAGISAVLDRCSRCGTDFLLGLQGDPLPAGIKTISIPTGHYFERHRPRQLVVHMA